MFKALLLAIWYDLSDVALAEARSDRASFFCFCGFSRHETTPERTAFARFRRQQILRILIRDVLGFGALSDVTAELSALADAIVETAYERIHRDLVSRYGHPRAESGGPAHFAVIALGKLGGEELNYSSDIDLMFLYSANGVTDGAASLTNKEFFKRAANELTALLSAYTPEGMCYRVDLRLRPEGSLGEVCISLEGARQYYESRARDWELQMMIKARIAAGSKPGRFLRYFVADWRRKCCASSGMSSRRSRNGGR